VREREREERLPAELHELVVAEARESPANHELEPDENHDLQQRDDDLDDDDRPVLEEDLILDDPVGHRDGALPGAGEIEAAAVEEGDVPATEEEHRGDRGQTDDLHELTGEE